MPKAAVCEVVGAPLEIRNVDLAEPKAGEVRVRIAASGVCHSDLSVQNGTLYTPVPAVLGHEGAGVIDAIGEGVTDLAVGDHVVISWVPQCGECFFCRRHQGHLCEQGSAGLLTGGLMDGTPRFSLNAQPIFQMACAGTFSEATIVPSFGAIKIDPAMPLDRAALIGCSVLTGVGAAMHSGNVGSGDCVVVIGCGGVGLNVIQGARLCGAERIVAIDMHSHKLDLARRFGATDTVLVTEDVDPVAEVLGLTELRGADVVFEAIGLRATMQQSIAMTRRGGTAVMIGVPSLDTRIELDAAMDIVIMEKRIRGCWYGSSDVHVDIPDLVARYQDGSLLLDELISREIPLEDVNAAFDAMMAGEVARSIIRF
ncbi:MAG: Zn-dependent alcohol dehydrogenase [Acidimicrobiia bacterium]